MARLQIIAVAVFATMAYLLGVAAGELLPRYDFSIQAGGFMRFDRWTGQVEVAVLPSRPASWLKLMPQPRRASLSDVQEVIPDAPSDPFIKALEGVRQDQPAAKTAPVPPSR